MSFFEPPPPPPEPEPEELEQPEWIGPSRNVLGAAVSIRLVLAKTDDVAIAVTDATAYPNGFEFKLVGRSRRLQDELDPFENPFMWRHRRWRPGREVPAELFRFGIEFSDGAKATNLGGAAREAEDARPGPVLDERGGRGGGGRWEEEYWVWPLPPPGRFAFVCEWPAMGIPLTRKEIDASLIRDAAERAETLWEDASGSSPGGRWRSFGPRS